MNYFEQLNYDTKPSTDCSRGTKFSNLAIKKFNREVNSVDGSELLVRPPIILHKTLCYMRDCIVDQDRIERG